MKAVGVVVEYNPFHNGHAYHLQRSKELSGAEVVIAAMSGNFLQRGEPALVSKWERTRMALEAGVDLVFELPYRFATQHAEIFAEGAVSILTASGCDSFCFGSESGELDAFLRTIDFLEQNNERFQENIKNYTSSGFSYPKAISLSFQSLSPDHSFVDITSPNNILGLHYIQAVLTQGSCMNPYTIPRKNAAFHDEHFSSASIASATSIRKALSGQTNELGIISELVPASTLEQLIRYKDSYGGFHSWENYWMLLKYKLLHSGPEELREIYEVEEGLENRLLAAAGSASSFHEFMETIKTKRYTWTRLQRVCTHILTNTKKAEMKKDRNVSRYLRLLGATSTGRNYLRTMKKEISLPIVSKLSSFSDPDIDLDVKASRIYSLGLQDEGQKRLLAEEYSRPPIMLST